MCRFTLPYAAISCSGTIPANASVLVILPINLTIGMPPTPPWAVGRTPEPVSLDVDDFVDVTEYLRFEEQLDDIDHGVLDNGDLFITSCITNKSCSRFSSLKFALLRVTPLDTHLSHGLGCGHKGLSTANGQEGKGPCSAQPLPRESTKETSVAPFENTTA